MRKGQCLTRVMLAAIALLFLGGTFTSEDVVSRLRSDDPQVREKAARDVIQERERLINDVRNAASDFKHNLPRSDIYRTSVTLLGNLIAVEAIPFLVDNIDNGAYVKRARTLVDLFPCIGALIEIGYPAVNPLFEKAENTDDEDTINNIAYALYHILGKNIAGFCLQKRAQRQEDLKKRTRLLMLQRWLTKWEARGGKW